MLLIVFRASRLWSRVTVLNQRSLCERVRRDRIVLHDIVRLIAREADKSLPLLPSNAMLRVSFRQSYRAVTLASRNGARP